MAFNPPNADMERERNRLMAPMEDVEVMDDPEPINPNDGQPIRPRNDNVPPLQPPSPVGQPGPNVFNAEGVNPINELNRAQQELNMGQQQLAEQLVGLARQQQENARILWDEIQATRQVRSNAAQVNVVSAKPPKPETFHGSGKPKKRVDNWLFNMETYFKAIRMPREQWVEFAVTFLRDGAAIWWRSHLNLVAQGLDQLMTDWENFSRVIYAQFTPVNAPKIARDDLYFLRQTRSVMEYIEEFSDACLKIEDLGAGEKLDKFVRGLKPHIAEKVEIENPETVDEAMQIAQRIDSIQTTNFLRRKNYNQLYGNKSSHKPSYPKREFNAMTVQLSDSSVAKTKSEPSLSTMKFSNNGYRNKFNKFQSKPSMFTSLSYQEKQRCMKERLCFKCKRPNHMIKDCSLNKSQPFKKSFKSNKYHQGKGKAQ